MTGWRCSNCRRVPARLGPCALCWRLVAVTGAVMATAAAVLVMLREMAR